METLGPLHHFGFVVADVNTALQGFTRSLAAVWDGQVHIDPHQKVRVAFLSTGPWHPLIELIEPSGDESPVQRFLATRGGGLHHLCYEVVDLEHAIAAMKSRGCLTVRRPRPAIAFDGRRIAWMFTAEKLLIELLEKDCSGSP